MAAQQQMIFVNLPVENLERSKAFYEAIGFTNEPKFTDDNGAAMVLSDTIFVMLLAKPFYATFTGKPIADAHRSTQVLLAITRENREAVDRIVDAAESAGGKADPGPKQDHGFMYGRSFEDPDGHHWEPLWMDPQFAEQGAHPVESAAA
jgi:predicted lactoylglutathione lyase